MFVEHHENQRPNCDEAPGTLLEALWCAAAARDAGHTYYDGRASNRATYEQIAEEAQNTGSRLAAMSVRRGDRVAIALNEPQSFVRFFFSVLVAGAVPVPMASPGRKEAGGHADSARSILRASGASAVVCDGEFAERFVNYTECVGTLRTVVTPEMVYGQPKGTIERFVGDPDDIAFLQFTSGSTANPKGVVVTNRSLLANARAITGSHGLMFDREQDTAVSWLPLFHDMGLIGFVVAPLAVQGNAVLIPTSRFVRRPGSWFDAIQYHRGTITFAPNFALALLLRRLANSDWSRWRLEGLRVVGCGAEPIDAAVLERFSQMLEKHCGVPDTAVLPCYGLAEATLAVTFGRRGKRFYVDEIDADTFAARGRAFKAAAIPRTRVRKIVSCGSPFPEHELRILRDDGSPAEERCEGEVVVRGPSVASGYFGDAAATRASFRGGWLFTGDLGYIADGELFVSGRAKDLIICYGRNVHAGDLELIAARVSGARPGGTVAFASRGQETEEVVIVVETADDSDSALAARVVDCVRSTFDVPVADCLLVPLGFIFRTSSGKPRRRAMRDWYIQRKSFRE